MVGSCRHLVLWLTIQFAYVGSAKNLVYIQLMIYQFHQLGRTNWASDGELVIGFVFRHAVIVYIFLIS